MKKTIKDARSFTTETKEVLRFRTVEAVLNGMTQVQASRNFSVARGTVARWMKMYRSGGKRALKGHKQGRPKGESRLKGLQASLVVRAVKDRTPDQLKMPFALWTREAVQMLVASEFDVKVSLTTIGRWLKRWGFTPQKPVRRSWEQDSAEVKRWLNEEYPRIRAAAKRESAEIHWGNEMGIRSDHQSGKSYGRVGQTPIITGTGKRFGCQMISSITNRGTLRFMLFKNRFNTKVFIAFLKRLIKSADRKVYLIVDRHPVHKAKHVSKWIERNSNKIRLFYLPAYSPELNPDELLNNDVKSNAVGRRRAGTPEELLCNVRGYLRSTQKQPAIVKSYFRANTVCYTAY